MTTTLRTVGSGLKSFVQAFGAAREAATEYDRLRRMTDRQLARRGLTRDDIPRAVGHVLGV